MMTIDDSDRMIQEVLSELGCNERPETIANKVKRQYLTPQYALVL